MVGPQAQVREASAGFVLPVDGLPEELQPILEILPLQMLAYEITLARGQDPDAPQGPGQGDGDPLRRRTGGRGPAETGRWARRAPSGRGR